MEDLFGSKYFPESTKHRCRTYARKSDVAMMGQVTKLLTNAQNAYRNMMLNVDRKEIPKTMTALYQGIEFWRCRGGEPARTEFQATSG